MTDKDIFERSNIDYQTDEDMRSEPSQNANTDYIYGEGVQFQRLRRITGYLVGDISRWNNGKRAELNDRIKHHS